MVRAISIGRTISFCVLGPATEAMAHPLCVSGSAVVVRETRFGFSRGRTPHFLLFLFPTHPLERATEGEAGGDGRVHRAR